jgi:Raf kinase inhibitor-like YbhB/YbcL family protein
MRFAMTFLLASGAFPNGGAIPKRYAQEGENKSPPLRWEGAPAGTKSFALIVEDPDAPAGTYRHWAIYNLDARADHLPEGVSAGEFAQAINDSGNASYDGPRPPKGHGPHHYHFRLAALDVPVLKIDTGSKASELWRAAEPHILDEAEFVGTYETS